MTARILEFRPTVQQDARTADLRRFVRTVDIRKLPAHAAAAERELRERERRAA